MRLFGWFALPESPLFSGIDILFSRPSRPGLVPFGSFLWCFKQPMPSPLPPPFPFLPLLLANQVEIPFFEPRPELFLILDHHRADSSSQPSSGFLCHFKWDRVVAQPLFRLSFRTELLPIGAPPPIGAPFRLSHHSISLGPFPQFCFFFPFPDDVLAYHGFRRGDPARFFPSPFVRIPRFFFFAFRVPRPNTSP